MTVTLSNEKIHCKNAIITQTPGVKHFYKIFSYAGGTNFEGQWNKCSTGFNSFFRKRNHFKPFIVRIFVASENQDEFTERKSFILKSYPDWEFPFSVLSQSPAFPYLVMIEAGFTDKRQTSIVYAKDSLLHLCRLSSGTYSEAWIAGAYGFIARDDTQENAKRAFNGIQLALESVEMGFDQVVRQWNYIENIHHFRIKNGHQYQNYQLFNEVRGNYYSQTPMPDGYPAATGTGTFFSGITIECMAVSTDNKGLKIVPVGNPQQRHAYKYEQSVLRGEPAVQHHTNQVPLFERAKLVTDGQNSVIYVSGTASIKGQETVGPDDPEQQTLVSIGNIETLTCKQNLLAHCPDLKVIPDNYSYIRVYVKNKENLSLIRKICTSHFGNIPASYVIADICRDDLLVEIEAEKSS